MRFLKSCGFVLLLLVISIAHAQDMDADSTFITDSDSLVIEAKTDADSVFVFDSVTAEGIAPVPERKIHDSILRGLRNDEAFWYANTDFKKKEAKPQDRSGMQRLFLQEWFRNLLWIIIIGAFVVVLVLFLMKSNIRLFHRAPAAINTAEETALTENIFSIDYNAEVSKAVQSGNLRLAVRLYYLQTLKLLSTKNIIQYKEDFTNSDYLVQLRPTMYYAAFKNLTHHFEYTWYGQFPVTLDIYKAIETDFRAFKNNMGI